MSNYFSYLPDVYVRLDSIRKQGVDPYVQAKNLFRRIKIRDDLSGALLGFQQYSVQGNERPDNVAEKAYGDPKLDWVILLANNIINIYNEWPMSEAELMDYVERKYKDNPETIHHYETVEIRNNQGELLLDGGLEVNADYKYTDSNGTIYLDKVKPVTNYENELMNNDYKRNIYLLKPAFLANFISEFTDLVEYLPNEEVDEDDLKKTFSVIDESYLTDKTTYESDIGRVAVTKRASSQDYGDRVFATSSASAQVAFTVAQQQEASGTVTDSGVYAGTQDSGSTNQSSSNESSSSSSGSGYGGSSSSSSSGSSGSSSTSSVLLSPGSAMASSGGFEVESVRKDGISHRSVTRSTNGSGKNPHRARAKRLGQRDRPTSLPPVSNQATRKPAMGRRAGANQLTSTAHMAKVIETPTKGHTSKIFNELFGM